MTALNIFALLFALVACVSSFGMVLYTFMKLDKSLDKKDNK